MASVRTVLNTASVPDDIPREAALRAASNAAIAVSLQQHVSLERAEVIAAAVQQALRDLAPAQRKSAAVMFNLFDGETDGDFTSQHPANSTLCEPLLEGNVIIDGVSTASQEQESQTLISSSNVSQWRPVAIPCEAADLSLGLKAINSPDPDQVSMDCKPQNLADHASPILPVFDGTPQQEKDFDSPDVKEGDAAAGSRSLSPEPLLSESAADEPHSNSDKLTDTKISAEALLDVSAAGLEAVQVFTAPRVDPSLFIGPVLASDSGFAAHKSVCAASADGTKVSSHAPRPPEEVSSHLNAADGHDKPTYEGTDGSGDNEPVESLFSDPDLVVRCSVVDLLRQCEQAAGAAADDLKDSNSRTPCTQYGPLRQCSEQFPSASTSRTQSEIGTLEDFNAQATSTQYGLLPQSPVQATSAITSRTQCEPLQVRFKDLDAHESRTQCEIDGLEDPNAQATCKQLGSLPQNPGQPTSSATSRTQCELKNKGIDDFPRCAGVGEPTQEDLWRRRQQQQLWLATAKASVRAKVRNNRKRFSAHDAADP